MDNCFPTNFILYLQKAVVKQHLGWNLMIRADALAENMGARQSP